MIAMRRFSPSRLSHLSRPSGPSGQSGMTLIEILVGMLLSVLVLFIFRTAYKTLARGNQDVDRTTVLQREVKAMSRDLEIDLKRAGFGVAGTTVFSVMKKSQVRFLYRDLVGATCAANDTAVVTYTADAHALLREVVCSGTAKPAKRIDISPDSLALSLAYLDGTGAATGSAAFVKTVTFIVEIVSNPLASNFHKTRAAQSSVAIVNNP
jgi:Tfp pilus assembly protein PilW